MPEIKCGRSSHARMPHKLLLQPSTFLFTLAILLLGIDSQLEATCDLPLDLHILKNRIYREE